LGNPQVLLKNLGVFGISFEPEMLESWLRALKTRIIAYNPIKLSATISSQRIYWWHHHANCKTYPTHDIINQNPKPKTKKFYFHYKLQDVVAIGNPSGMCAKLRTMAASSNRDHASQSLFLLLARATYIMVLVFTHTPLVVNLTINATPPDRLQQHPLFFTTNRTDCTFFVWRLNLARPPHPGHSIILLWSEIWAACAQSFVPWQQATIEIMRHNLSCYCLLVLHI